jgi:hypothetical protein
MTAGQITEAARAAGLLDVHATPRRDRVIAPALRLTAARPSHAPAAPTRHRVTARRLPRQVELRRRKDILDYLLLPAARP